MTALSENAAVLTPWATLPRRQQQLLLDVEPMQTLRVRGGWLVRGAKVSQGTVHQMEARGLIREQVMFGRERLLLTEAGKLAAARLADRRAAS